MEWTWKRTIAVALFFIVLIAGPIFLMSNPMMEYYQKKIDQDPNSNFSKWLQITSANICYKTMRPELSAEYYRRFIERYKEDERRPFALLRYALSLEDSGRNKDAIDIYTQYINDYPDRQDKQEAITGIDRIRYVKPVK